MKYLIKITISFLLLMMSVFLFSCKEDNTNNPGDTPPELPPVASIQMDFDNFPSTAALSKINGNLSLDTSQNKNNWGFAYVNGAVWHTLLKVGMAIPVAAFAESFNHEAQQQEDGKWMWTYQFTPLGGVNHTASLYANVDNNGVTWEMYISKGSQFSNFLWFSGHSDLAATEGTWTIYNEPNNPSPWIGIEWHRNPSNSTADIKYTNIAQGDTEFGGYIFYGKTTDAPYNAFYEIYNKGKENMISVMWNLNSHEGRVRDMVHFRNNNWHCWDSNLDDIDCPQ